MSIIFLLECREFLDLCQYIEGGVPSFAAMTGESSSASFAPSSLEHGLTVRQLSSSRIKDFIVVLF